MRIAACLLLPALCAALPQLRVLALGDSLTFGCGSDAAPPNWFACCLPTSGGYRAPLWAALNSSSINASVLMVGTESSGPAYVPVEQRAHEGHPGWTIAQIATLRNKWVSVAPDVVLLMAGTNDIGQGHNQSRIVSDYAALLALLRASLPSTSRIMVASIFNLPDSAHPEFGPAISALNAALPALVQAVPGASYIDMNAATGLCKPAQDPLAPLCAVCNGPCGGYNRDSCPPIGYSYCHPTGAGYALVGGVWAGVLLPILHELAAARAL